MHVDQLPLSLFIGIIPEKENELSQILAALNDNIKTGPFNRLKGTHFCRFLILPEDKKLNLGPILAFESNYDHSLDNHLEDLTQPEILKELVAIFSCCTGFKIGSNPKNSVQDFIKSNQHPVPCFYRGHRGLPVALIKREQKIYQSLQSHLNALNYHAVTPSKTKTVEEIQEDLFYDLQTKVPLEEPIPMVSLPKQDLESFGLKTVIQVLVVLVLALVGIGLVSAWWIPLIVLGLLFLGIYGVYRKLRSLEQNAISFSETERRAVFEQVPTWAGMEDKVVQNQLSHLVPLRTGWWRQQFQKLALWAINLLAVKVFNQGKLGDISSIHFARWSIIDKGKRLIFFSNFDGTWENYLGDFVDRAAKGLTLAWSNTEGFPRTTNLINDGATDEERFKIWARKYQTSTHFWFSAYPDLTVKNILTNHKVALGLQKQGPSRDEISDWFKLL